ncbi:hypothetical protein [Lysinibacillus sp. NPDC086135]|uniref:hypothetical protein n=1 Tax=Lysinibacillus sp. NPDC086135 TaxID=3364130 RepID=UPI0038293585
MKYFAQVYKNPEEIYDIKFELMDKNENDEQSDSLPKEIKELHKNIEKTCNVIKNLTYTSDAVKEKYFKKLLSLSQVAFVSEKLNALEIATNSLEVLQEEILLVEGKRIKNMYMVKLGVSAFIYLAISWVTYFLLRLIGYSPNEYLIYVTVWSGAMIGTWISFGARKFNITLEDLSSIEEDKMNIIIRLPYIGLCSLIFLLFLNSGIFNLTIGNSSIKDTLENNFEMQILLGVLAGLLESKLGIKIYEKANNIIEEVR